VAAGRSTYTATFERADGGTWVVEVAEEPNVHGYGATLAEARRNTRDAITTLFGPFGTDGDSFELVDDIRLPDAVLDVVNLGRRQREQAGELLAAARAAEEAVVDLTRDAVAVLREAGRLLVEHGFLVETQADDFELSDDVRVPEAVMLTVERAHVERQTAIRQREIAFAARATATEASRQAVATSREAAALLVEDCGLTVAEAAGLLRLTPERTQRLLTE